MPRIVDVDLNLYSLAVGSKEPVQYPDEIWEELGRIIESNPERYDRLNKTLLSDCSATPAENLPRLIIDLNSLVRLDMSNQLRAFIHNLIESCAYGIEMKNSLIVYEEGKCDVEVVDPPNFYFVPPPTIPKYRK